MPDASRRRAYATTGVGAGLVATGGMAREHTIRSAERLTGAKRKSWRPPSSVLLRHNSGIGLRRAGWVGGSLMGIAGGTGTVVGLHELAQRRRDAEPDELAKSSFIREGLAGNFDAVNQRVDNARQPAPWKARAAALGAGAAAGGVGSAVTHKLVDRVARDSHFRPAWTALGGTLAAASTLPLSSKITRRVAPGYEVTPTGVKRRKKPPVRPSKMANVVETRSGRRQTRNSRSQIVPSSGFAKRESVIHLAVGRSGRPACGTGPRPNTQVISATRSTKRVTCKACTRTHQARSLAAVGKLDTNYPGYGLSHRNKRARVYAAGAVPLIGTATATAEAARLAPPEQRKRAAAEHYAGVAGGGAIGATGGAYGTAALSRRSGSRIQERSGQIAEGIHDTKRWGASKLPGKLGDAASRAVGQDGPGWAARRVKQVEDRGGLAGRAVTRAAKPLRGVGHAAAIGGLGGKVAGGVVGGYLGYGAALRAEDARNRKLAVAKWGTPPPMSHREQVKQYHRRRRNLGLGILTTAAGSVGAGALAAAHGGHLPRVGPTLARNKGKIERIGLNSALIGGGIGAVQGFQNIGIQHRDLDAKKKELKLSKSAPRLVRTAGFRQSYLRATPRGRVRVANTVTKIDSNHWAEMPALRRAADRTEAEVFPPLKRKLRIRRGTDSKGSVVRRPLSKIDTTMSANDAHSYAHKYGTRGPLPKGLDRDEKMKAYEGRYIVAGGPKGERWHKRADQLDRVTGAALGVGGAAAMGELAAKTKRGTAFLSRRGHGVQAAVHRTNRIGLGAAGVGALSELAHRHAAHKQAAYSNSAAGVAASALRRMRDYTPD